MKSKITFLILLFSTLFANAQVEFEDHTVMDNALYVQSPQAVFAADLDGDGDKDVLTSSYFGNKLVWLENLDGTGAEFTLHEVSATVQAPWAVYAADLDADGDLDFIAASASASNVMWYENTDGAGTFVLKQATYAYKANFVRAADMDNDNDLDLVYSSNSEGDMKWIRNTDGLGTFSDTLNIESNVSSIPGFYVTDMDGDGDKDIVSSYTVDGGGQGVSWYKNNGAGGFGSRILISNAVDYVTSVYVGDMDGDGDMDVVSASAGDNKIAWYKNTDGLGAFGPQQVLSLTAQEAAVVRLADVDGDNDLDVVFGSNDDYKIGWIENTDGLGTFSSENLISLHAGTIRDICFSDMDADGDLDFITATSADSNIKLYNNTDGTGTYTSSIITKHIDGGRIIRAEDIDGDGDKDIIGASYWDGKISWYENLDGQGNFYNAQKIISDTVDGATSVCVGDVDGDGFKDVLATSYLDTQIVWFKNTDGLGTFAPAQIIDNNLYNANKVFLADIDNDGDLDVFGLGYQKFTWYRNGNGQGSFSSAQIIEAAGNTNFNSMDFGDLDGDGDLDISVVTVYGLYYYFNTDGLGTFGTKHAIEDYPNGCASLKIADLDNDGDKDIVYAGRNINSGDPAFVRWAENTNGLGTFSETHLISTIVATPKCVVTADFDDDGDIDIATADEGNGGVVAWYKNTDAQGSFENTQQIISQNLNSPFDLFVADIDGNNTPDIVSTSEYDDKVVWHKNTILPTSNSINGTIRFDLLGDGCSDTDPALSGILVVATDNVNTNATFSQENGHFQLYTTEEGTVTTKITSQSEYYAPTPATFVSDFTGLGNNDEVNFCIEPIGSISDLAVSFYPTRLPRPGFETFYRIVYRNEGLTLLSGSVTFEFDGSKLSFGNSSAAVSSQTANSVTFNFTGLYPFESKTIDLTFNVFTPPVTNIGDTLITTTTINPVTGDNTEDNNVFSLSQTVVGSYDPNDMTCLEGNEVLVADADKYLHYLIRFQNTGTADAINVRVDQTLDSKLDWTTMQLESLSHQGQVNIHNGSELSFVFDNINLPDSTDDEPNSHGFIAYKIKPKDNVALGDIINATADIYFDFNPAVVTNTAATEFVNVLSVDGLDTPKVTVSPNPTTGILNIAANTKITNVDVYNYLGQLVLSVKETSRVDISSLSQGVYVMSLRDVAGAVYTQKIIKK